MLLLVEYTHDVFAMAKPVLSECGHPPGGEAIC